VELNDQFEKLSAMLSVDRKGKLRKTSILLEAISVITTLRNENSRLRAAQQQSPSSISLTGHNSNGTTTSNKRSRVRQRSGSSQYPHPSTSIYRSASSSSLSSPVSAPAFPPRNSSEILDDLSTSDISMGIIKRSQSYGASTLSHDNLNAHFNPLSPTYAHSRSQPPSPMGFPYPMSNSYNGSDHLPPFPEQPIPPLVDTNLLNLDIDTNPTPSNDIASFLLSPTAFSSQFQSNNENNSTSTETSSFIVPPLLEDPMILSKGDQRTQAQLFLSLTPTASSQSPLPPSQQQQPRIQRSLTQDSSLNGLKPFHYEFNQTNPFFTDWPTTTLSNINMKPSMDFPDNFSPRASSGTTGLDLDIALNLNDMLDDNMDSPRKLDPDDVDSPRTIKTESPLDYLKLST